MRKLNIDNPFFAFMGRVGDIMEINILFILCSLPLVTIGASLSAMYGSFFRLADGEGGAVWRIFLGELKKHWKEATAGWLLMFPAGGILAFDIYYTGQVDLGPLWHVVQALTGGMFFLWAMLQCSLYAVASWGDGGLRSLVKRAFLLSVRYFHYTFFIILVKSIPWVCFLLDVNLAAAILPVYLLAGFGGSAYIHTLLLKNVLPVFYG